MSGASDDLRALARAFCRGLESAVKLAETAQADAYVAGEIEAERALGRLADALRDALRESLP